MSSVGKNSEQDLRDVRREYEGVPLRRVTLNQDPVEEFRAWMELAAQYHPEDATCMTLATVDADGMPSARTVLLKHFDQQGFCWYTNSGSQKGRELARNPQAALHFYWSNLHRQVRMVGTVDLLPRANAEDYFYERPLGSQISCYVSRQSEVVANREVLEVAAEQAAQDYAKGRVPCPEEWCGYRLLPQQFEFWQGRENRLHDRFRYRLSNDAWLLDRLAP